MTKAARRWVRARQLRLAGAVLAGALVAPLLAPLAAAAQEMPSERGPIRLLPDGQTDPNVTAGQAPGSNVTIAPSTSPSIASPPTTTPPVTAAPLADAAEEPGPDQSAAIPDPRRAQPDPLHPPGQPPGQPGGAPGSLGQIPGDYEVHGELALVSGQLEGFNEACGFGRRPDRDELMEWYRHHELARDIGRIRGIYELGVELGREGPCTVGQHQALVAYWEALMGRTRTYVENYR